MMVFTDAFHPAVFDEGVDDTRVERVVPDLHTGFLDLGPPKGIAPVMKMMDLDASPRTHFGRPSRRGWQCVDQEFAIVRNDPMCPIAR